MASGACGFCDPLPFGGGVSECLGAYGGGFFGDEEAGTAGVLVQGRGINDEGDEPESASGYLDSLEDFVGNGISY